MRSSSVLVTLVLLAGAPFFACSSGTPAATSPNAASSVSQVPDGVSGVTSPDASASANAPTATRGEMIWRGKCAACHTPVAPGSHDRAFFEAAMQRHRKRLHLEENDWASLVEFLSKQP